MFGSPVVAIITLTLAFAFIYAGIKNESIIDVLTGKNPGIATGVTGALTQPGIVAPLLGTKSSTTISSTPTTKQA